MTLVMVPMRDGRLMLTTGFGLVLLDPETGDVLRHYPLEGRGWAAVAPAADGEFAIIGNFFTGELIRMRLADGEIVARTDVGQKKSLSGIAEFPG
jgi:hypothetical protein